MKLFAAVAAALVLVNTQLTAQGLREVPQRFALIQPAGLLVGIGTAGIELGVGRRSSVELGGIAVYSQEDGVRISGGGGGIGFRYYPNSGELSGTVVGVRLDVVSLNGESFRINRTELYLGVGGFVGYRWLTRSGVVVEPVIGYEYLAGQRPLVPGSQPVQDDLGLILGIGIGHSW